MAQRSILVTGAAGFIGSHTCGALLARGETVIGLDNLDPFYDPEFKRQNLHELSTAHPGQFSFVHADVADAEAVRRVFAERRPGGVIHLAAKAGVRPSIADPAGYARTNVLGTSIMLDAAAGHGCERIVIPARRVVREHRPRLEHLRVAAEGRGSHPLRPWDQQHPAAQGRRSLVDRQCLLGLRTPGPGHSRQVPHKPDAIDASKARSEPLHAKDDPRV